MLQHAEKRKDWLEEKKHQCRIFVDLGTDEELMSVVAAPWAPVSQFCM